MFKIFQQSNFSGKTSQFWEENWSTGSIENAVSFYDINPDKIIFDRFLPKSGLILEGGCGLGQYIYIWSNERRRVVGLDFTFSPLKKFKQTYSTLSSTIINGDVSKLPFKDNTFDAYYSGGVVEHFENGPYEALKEAYRVLKPNGTLIISVPFYNLVRFLNNHFFYKRERNGKGVWLKEPSDKIKFNGYNFFQYAYKKNEFKCILEHAGFEVVNYKKVGFLWGLRELKVVDNLMKRLELSTKSGQPINSIKKDAAFKSYDIHKYRSKINKFIKYVVIREDIKLFPPVFIFQTIFANMIFYICTPKKMPGTGSNLSL